MSKELTEKYYNGTLPSGYYYFNNGNETYPVEHRQTGIYCLPSGITVVEPVPSYDEWKQAKENLDKNGTWYTERSYKLIEKKLEIAIKDLEELEKENKKLKAQLEEANSDGLESIHWFGSDHF